MLKRIPVADFLKKLLYKKQLCAKRQIDFRLRVDFASRYKTHTRNAINSVT